jgi:hypothetical protein
VEADLPGPGLVEEESRRGIENVLAQFIPGIGLSEYVLGQAFGAIAAVCFLDRFKD